MENYMLYLYLVLAGVLSFLVLGSDAQKYRYVILGGWLIVEGWITPWIFDGVQDRDLMDGAQIQLKSVKWNTFIIAINGGGKNLAVNREKASTWETFRVWRVKDGTYHLRAFNKQFVGAINAGGGIVNVVVNTPKEWETFQIIRNPSNNKQVHIKAYNRMYFQQEHKYYQAQSQDQLTADFQVEPGWNDGNAATFEINIVTGDYGIAGEYQLRNDLGPDKAPKVSFRPTTWGSRVQV